MRKRLVILLSGFLLLAGSACNEYQKVLKSPNVDFKYEKAVEYYNEGEYDKAYPLFDELLVLYRGSEKAADVYYYYAMCSFELKDFILAAYHFKNFAKTFPTHPKTEMAYYMVGYCHYLESPDYSLDQDYTFKAINDLQLFANLYPNSDKLLSTNELIDELRAKLERKSFERAMQYFHMEYYQSAVVSFNNVMDDYPDTEYREEAMFHKCVAAYRFADNSISEKQFQRYIESRTAYLDFKEYFPESDYNKTLDKLFANIDQQISELKPQS
ncbi:outer membrane protein assembly factor BamD [Croceimicrobium hydrocarbonivorans]|uniref:Outer membrane protein assembly factor BamD n=1 Tax=Croceimicrobium hydrocarbonivorans TaxID=2761580 RepID=A0A7H0VEJ2_9FLAO|nr:outer membrane protein assembly factor BamD [Croceimicrobium hydrocarbonivorans]QNR24140.1 outer membrane protein assembly factor BamD [Croceimicrobium hydrocarbonivorans]